VCSSFNADLKRKADAQGTLTLSSGQQKVVDTLTAPAKALMDASHISESIHKGVNTFMEAVPPLMKALDEVAKIHPFISGENPLFRIAAALIVIFNPEKLPLLRSRLHTRLKRYDARTIREF
jgi:hypothetical protein